MILFVFCFFCVFGLQQIVIGGLDKVRLCYLWLDLLGVLVIGNFKSECENVDEDICMFGQGVYVVEVDFMQLLDFDKKLVVYVMLFNYIGLWVDDLFVVVQWLEV